MLRNTASVWFVDGERDPFGKKSRERDFTRCMVAENDEREPGNNMIFFVVLFYFIYSFFYEIKLKIYYSVLEIRKIIIIVSKSKDNLLMNYLLLSLSVLK